MGLDESMWLDELNQFIFNDENVIGAIEKQKQYTKSIKTKITVDIKEYLVTSCIFSVWVSFIYDVISILI